ncbi:MAG: CRTAC1 family protein [Alphaproteobacteria bacterium]|nr:CRTAC1 family protein [Alphaproteobacteria bacterium]
MRLLTLTVLAGCALSPASDPVLSPPTGSGNDPVAPVETGDPADDAPDAETAETGAVVDPGRARVIPEPLRTFALPAACPPERPLCDVSEAAGLHAAPKAYGRGASIVDVDGDGLDDLWQGHARNDHRGADRGGLLWRSVGDGTFEPLTLGIPAEHSQGNWGAAWADWDGDGDPDVLLTNGGYDGTGQLRLYRNDLATAGAFTEVTAASGIETSKWAWWGAAWADFDRDGHLDLVITSRSLMSIPPCCVGTYETDTTDVEAPVRLYRGRGDGTFEDVATALGIGRAPYDAHQPVWWDYDADGWLDLFIPNMGDWSTYRTDSGQADTKRDAHVALYRNLQGQGFEEVSEDVLPDLVTHQGPVFSVAPLDVDQDGRDDLFVGRGWLQAVILRSVGDGTVELLGREVGLDHSLVASRPENTMGLNVGDLTGDGFPEIFVGPGSPDMTSYPVPFVHTGAVDGLRFRRTDMSGEPDLHGQHHGSALGDLDQDGDIDLFWNMGGFGRWDARPFNLPPGVDPRTVDSRAFPVLMAGGPSASRTAAVRLRGTVSNREAIGAKVRVTGTATRWYGVPTTVGFQSRNSPWLTVSLGQADEAEVQITWPSGLVTTNTITAGSRQWLEEPEVR